MTKFQKELYNTWLYETRKAQNKPFNARKDFSSLSKKDIIALNRIATMLKKYPHIKPEQYFKAPYAMNEKDYYELSFFGTMKGIRALTLYLKHLQELPPDTDHHLQSIADSLKFIAKFCHYNKIKLEEYPTHKTSVTYSWMKHVKNRDVSIFTLMEFSEIYDIIISTPEDERELLLGDAGKYFLGYKTKYLKSDTARTLVKRGLDRIRKLQSSV